MARFIIRQTNTGIKFDLKAPGGELLATSEVYTTERACKNGILSVTRNASIAHLEDQTTQSHSVAKHPKFEVYQDRSGKYRFRLKARNGEVIATSDGYRQKTSCLNGVEGVRRYASTAEIVRE